MVAQSPYGKGEPCDDFISWRPPAALSLLAGCSGEPSDPFSYVKVSGKVAYDDGSLVKVPDMLLIFHPLTSPIDPKTCPHSGMTLVNVATGEFLSVTTWRPGDGVVHGKHKVTLSPRGTSPCRRTRCRRSISILRRRPWKSIPTTGRAC